MLTFPSIAAAFPPHLQAFQKNMLREYLQYKILAAMFSSELGAKFSFLGGTALCLVHKNTRFSEDLDFDNIGVSAGEFETLGGYLQAEMQKEGFETEIRSVYKGAFRLYIRFPKVLYEAGLSPLIEEKVLIQIDTVPHNYMYEPEVVILNKFDVFASIRATPKPILLAQKYYAACNRKRAKGRDFFDIVFLHGLGVTPDYGYLTKNIGVTSSEELRKYVENYIKELDFETLAKDVEPFLFNSKDKQRVSLFPQFFKQALL